MQVQQEQLLRSYYFVLCKFNSKRLLPSYSVGDIYVQHYLSMNNYVVELSPKWIIPRSRQSYLPQLLLDSFLPHIQSHEKGLIICFFLDRKHLILRSKYEYESWVQVNRIYVLRRCVTQVDINSRI